MPFLYRLWPGEVEQLSGARLRIASVGEASEYTGRFIDECQGLFIVQPLERCSRISSGLFLDRRDFMAPLLRFGLDHADCFPVDKET